MKHLKNILSAAIVAVIASTSFAHGAQLNPDGIVKLKGFGGEEELDVAFKYAEGSLTLKHLIEDTGIDEVIPLPSVRQAMLKTYIIPILIKFRDKGIDDVKNDILYTMPLEELADLILNANYLDIQAVLYAACDVFSARVAQIQDIRTVTKLFDNLKKNKLKFPKPIQIIVSETMLASTYHLCKTLKRHNNTVYSLCLSPDGKKLFSGSAEKTIKIWDISNINQPSCIKTLTGHKAVVNSLCLSADGKTLFSGSYDNTIKIWDISKIKTSECIKTLKDHTKMVTSLCLSADGKTLFSGSADKTIKIWKISDINDPACIKTLQDHTKMVTSLCLSADEKTLFSGSADNTIKIWDISEINNPVCFQTLKDHTDWLDSLCLSPDGKKLFSGSYDNTIKIWNISKIKNPRCIQTLQGHTRSLCLSPDGKKLFSGSHDKIIKIWDISDIKSPACIQTLQGDDSWLYSLCLSADGGTLFSGYDNRTIKIWKKLTVNQSFKQTKLLMQAWLVAQIMRQPEGQKYVIAKHSSEETVWNELPDETKQILHNNVKIIRKRKAVKQEQQSDDHEDDGHQTKKPKTEEEKEPENK